MRQVTRQIIALAAPVVSIIIAGFVLANSGKLGLQLITLMALYTFSPVGKGLILAAPAFGVSELFASVGFLFIDAIEAAFVIWNFNYVTLIPWLGPRVKRIEKKAHKTLAKKRWLQRFSYLAIALFVFTPGPGTGPIIGSIIGRLLDLRKPYLFAAVLLGALAFSALLIFPIAQIIKFYGIKLQF